MVLDGGSLLFKAGFARDDAPRTVFPSVVTSTPTTTFGFQTAWGFVGDKAIAAIANQNHFCLERPIKHGLIKDWDQMQKVLF